MLNYLYYIIVIQRIHLISKYISDSQGYWNTNTSNNKIIAWYLGTKCQALQLLFCKRTDIKIV